MQDPSIPAGADASIDVNAVLGSEGRFGSVVQVAAAEPDPDIDNDRSVFRGLVRPWVTCGSVGVGRVVAPIEVRPNCAQARAD